MAALPRLQAAMVDHFLAHKAQAGEGLEVLPGVEELLGRLQARVGHRDVLALPPEAGWDEPAPVAARMPAALPRRRR